MTLTRLERLSFARLSPEDLKWLTNRTKDKRGAVRELAQRVYAKHFPQTEMNWTKRRLKIQELTFTVSEPMCNENTDDIFVSAAFHISRSDGSITLTYTDGGTEQKKIDKVKIPKLLNRLITHYEIFTWADRYCGEDEVPGEDFKGSGILNDILGIDENYWETLADENQRNTWIFPSSMRTVRSRASDMMTPFFPTPSMNCIGSLPVYLHLLPRTNK